MKKSLISVLILVAAVAAQGGGIRWVKAYDSARSAAKHSGKLMMIDFYTDWCGWCKKLDADTYPAAAVVKQSDKFVSVKLNAEKDSEGIRLAKKFKINGYPTVLFLDGNENLTYKIVGYQAAPQFAVSMSKAASIPVDKAKYDSQLKSNPRNVVALAGMASLCASTGQTDKAAELTERAAKFATPAQRGQVLDAYNATGDGYQNANEFPKAISYFERAVNPAFPKQTAYARISIATCYFSEQKPKSAAPYLRALLKMGKEADEFRAQAKQMLAMAK